MRKYFGTDGIRGEANRDLTVDIALRLGYALGYYLKQKKNNGKIKVIMGSDTRRYVEISSYSRIKLYGSGYRFRRSYIYTSSGTYH